jgi:hypothetical protein
MNENIINKKLKLSYYLWWILKYILKNSLINKMELM